MPKFTTIIKKIDFIKGHTGENNELNAELSRKDVKVI